MISWFKFELSVGTKCKCIREAGIACCPAVEQLVEELQEQEKIIWMKPRGISRGKCYGFGPHNARVVVYHIGTRKKELLKLITELFFGWLITDGYFACRFHEENTKEVLLI